MEEIKCDGCKLEFKKSELRVYSDSTIWCDDCWPKPPKPIIISIDFYWKDINNVRAYLDGETSLEILDSIDDFKTSIDYEILLILRKVLKKNGGTISEPDP